MQKSKTSLIPNLELPKH